MVGCVVNNQLILTRDLANDLNYDYISSTNATDQYTYRIKQSPKAVGNETVPQLTLSLWSGKFIIHEFVHQEKEKSLVHTHPRSDCSM